MNVASSQINFRARVKLDSQKAARNLGQKVEVKNSEKIDFIKAPQPILSALLTVAPFFGILVARNELKTPS